MSDVFQHRSIHEADHIEALQQQIRELQAENRSIRESLQDRRDRETNPDTRDYLLAMTGEGPQANNWADKPHRLVYDLINKVTAITLQRDDARDLAVRIDALLTNCTPGLISTLVIRTLIAQHGCES